MVGGSCHKQPYLWQVDSWLFGFQEMEGYDDKKGCPIGQPLNEL
jgi:hypothetical protein